jgi:hypothetical protein
MSEEGGFGVTLAEKVFGFLLLVIAAVAMYYVITSADALGAYTWFFGFLDTILIALGIFLITAKTE